MSALSPIYILIFLATGRRLASYRNQPRFFPSEGLRYILVFFLVVLDKLLALLKRKFCVGVKNSFIMNNIVLVHTYLLMYFTKG